MSRIALALVLVGILVSRLIEISDPDVFLHIRSGWWILENRTIPSTDPFSLFTLGMPWIDHQWLAQVGIALFSSPAIGGLIALSFVRAALIALSFFLLYRAMLARGVSMRIALVIVALGSLPGWMFSEARPYLVTYLGMAWMAWAWSVWNWPGGQAGKPAPLFSLRSWRGCPLYALPALMLLWANSHGGATVGLLYLAALLAGKSLEALHGKAPWPKVKILALVLLASTVASFISPHGWRILLFPFQVVGKDLFEARIFEWHPPSGEFEFWAYWVYLACFVVICLRNIRLLKLPDLLASALFIYMSLSARRHIPLMVYVTLPIFAEQFQTMLPRLRDRTMRLPRLAFPSLAAVLLLCVGIWAGLMVQRSFIPLGFGINPKSQPLGAIEFLEKSALQPNIFHDYNRGGYLVNRLREPWRAFIDGRVDIYGPQGLARHLKIMSGQPGWQDEFNGFNINTVLLDYAAMARMPSLARQLWDSPDWALVYWDDQGMIYARAESLSKDDLTKLEFKAVNPLWSARQLSLAAPKGDKRKQAYAELDRALKQPSDFIKALDFKSNLLGEDGKLSEAEALCRRILALKPNAAAAQYRLARILDSRNDLDGAEKAYKAFLKQSPNHAAAQVRLGTIEERRGENKKAMAWYQKVLKTEPTNQDALEGIKRVENGGR